MAERVSQLAGLLVAGRHGRLTDLDDGDALVLSSRLCAGLIQVNAWPVSAKKVATILQRVSGLKVSGHQASPGNDNFTIMPIGPGRYLISTSQADAEQVFREKIAADLGAVVNLADARVVFRISGKMATWVLAKGIAVDFAITTFPVESCIVTSHHDIGLTIRRVDENTFDLFVFTSFARSFWQWLDTAASEVGYEIK